MTDGLIDLDVVRKTENSSEIPNNCEECEHWNDTEDGCADRHGCKTEPTISKMEQVDGECADCKWHDKEWWYIKCDGCSRLHSHFEPKDEPQTYVINPQEPTNDDKCFECDDFFTCGGQCNKIEDEPQTERSE